MKREMEIYQNPAFPYIFRKDVKPGEKGVMEYRLTGHGRITRLTATFTFGENGTLRIRPYVEHPGELINELCKYAGDPYLSGDGCTYELPCYQEVENDTLLKIQYESTETDKEADPSQLIVDVIVQYDSYVEPRNVIG